MAEEQPDILSIVEHWCVEENIKLMILPGYVQVAYFCRLSHRNGGTAVYVKNGLKASDFNVSNLSEEMNCEICGVKIIANNLKLGVFSIYRSPMNDILAFLDKLTYVLQQCIHRVDSMFLCGDFNIDINKIDSKTKNLFVDFLNCFDFKITCFEPTRVFTDISGRTSSSFIDYILTNTDLKSCKTRVFEANLADHKVISLDYYYVSAEKKVDKKTQYVRDISQNNLNTFNMSIHDTIFADIYGESDVDVCFQTFVNTIRYVFEECCPLKRVCGEKDYSRGWITTEIRESSHHLKNLFWLHSNLKNFNSLQLYKSAKKEYNQLVNNTKSNYYAKLIENSSQKNKTVWNLVNLETGRTKSKDSEISLLLGENLCTDATLIAKSFAEYFSTITSMKLHEYFGKHLSPSCTTSKMLNSNFFFHPVSKNEVMNVINKLNNKKSTGIDFISTRLLKTINESISDHFASLINLSVSTGRFPDCLKKSMVTPVHKRGDPQDIANYRPISVLTNFSKIFEKIVFNRILEFLNKFNVITDSQHGFRPGRSTETAAYSFVEIVYRRLDEGMCVAGLFFDLSRAFDSLCFSFMLSKCYNLGFRGIFLDWLRSYMTGRTVKVRVNGASSDECEVVLGVPQGSVLGPLLFLLFINDLPVCIDADQITLFADDTSILVTARSPEELTESTSYIIRLFTDWCRMNKLMVNVEKTVLIHFGLKIWNRERISVFCGDISLTSREWTKFLGVYMDDGMRWSYHIDMVCKKLNSSFFAINKIKNLFPLTSILDVYYSLSYPHIAYNILTWGSSSDLNRVLICQKRIIRMIFNIHPRSSCRPYFIENKIMTVTCIYIFKCLLHMKKNFNSATKLSDFHCYSTRNTNVLTLPSHRTSRFERSPSYQSIKLFNHLPDSFKNENQIKFKILMKKLLLNKCYYSTADYLSDGSLELWSCKVE